LIISGTPQALCRGMVNTASAALPVDGAFLAR
jgi:hypothetical protein